LNKTSAEVFEPAVQILVNPAFLDCMSHVERQGLAWGVWQLAHLA
jgi:hypothetical protein